MRDQRGDDYHLVSIRKLLEEENDDSSDWKQAFECAGCPFHTDDIEVVIHALGGENEGDDWICYGVLKDGRWFCMSAGCDYTGWDCQASGSAYVADTKDELLRMGMTHNMRLRLGLLLVVGDEPGT